MRNSSRWPTLLTLLALVLVTCGTSGCRLFGRMAETTWKLNQGPALDESQGYFSVPDPVDAEHEL